MTEAAEITAETVRQTLLSRAAAFSDAHKVSLSAISEQAVRDSKFLANVQRGDNFTIKTYQRVLDWLDSAERERAA